MPSPFDAAMAAADVTIAATFGEPVLIIPRVPVARRGTQADVEREEMIVTGVVTISGGLSGADVSARPRLTQRLQLAESDVLVWLSEESLQLLGYVPRKDDEVQLIERPGFPPLDVVQDYPSNQKDVVLHLVRRP